VTNVPLGASRVDGSRTTPLAVLDSGGVQILVGYKPFVDAIYAAYGITASSDGNCKWRSRHVVPGRGGADTVRLYAMYTAACLDVYDRWARLSCAPIGHELAGPRRREPIEMYWCSAVFVQFGGHW
jgi:hypothetical protein